MRLELRHFYLQCMHLQVPGQYVGVHLAPIDMPSGSNAGDDTRTAHRLLPIASSPYDARRESSLLDASIIEVNCGCDVAIPEGGTLSEKAAHNRN